MIVHLHEYYLPNLLLTNIFLGFLLIVSEVAGRCVTLRCLNYLWTGLMLIIAEMGGSGECSLCFFSQAY